MGKIHGKTMENPWEKSHGESVEHPFLECESVEYWHWHFGALGGKYSMEHLGMRNEQREKKEVAGPFWK